jgi:nitrite reductase (NADH) small subunit
VAIPGGEEIAIFRTGGGKVYALVNRCPHKAGRLSQGIVHGDAVACPLHNWRISLATGEALGEDRGCVPTIPVRVDAGRILISRLAVMATAMAA